jgi:hypothetical protein
LSIFDTLTAQLTQQAAINGSQQLTGLANLGLSNLLGAIGLIPANQPNGPFNIDDFRTNLAAHGELARSDKFNVILTPPSAVGLASGTSLQELTLQCESAVLPSRDIALIEFRHYGFIKRIPHYNQYGVMPLTFLVTGDMWEKRLFDRWMDLLVPTNTGLITYPTDGNGQRFLEADIQVNQYSTNGNLIYSVNLLDAIPTSISELSLDWSTDSAHRLIVTFAFRKWVSDSTTASVPATDFGQAGGTNPLPVNAVGVVNNYTNQTSGPASIFSSAIGGGVVSSLTQAAQTGINSKLLNIQI